MHHARALPPSRALLCRAGTCIFVHVDERMRALLLLVAGAGPCREGHGARQGPLGVKLVWTKQKATSPVAAGAPRERMLSLAARARWCCTRPRAAHVCRCSGKPCRQCLGAAILILMQRLHSGVRTSSCSQCDSMPLALRQLIGAEKHSYCQGAVTCRRWSYCTAG